MVNKELEQEAAKYAQENYPDSPYKTMVANCYVAGFKSLEENRNHLRQLLIEAQQDVKTFQDAMEERAEAVKELEREVERLKEVLRQCDDYFDNYADADYIQEQYSPNPEMVLLSTIRQLLTK